MGARREEPGQLDVPEVSPAVPPRGSVAAGYARLFEAVLGDEVRPSQRPGGLRGLPRMGAQAPEGISGVGEGRARGAALRRTRSAGGAGSEGGPPTYSSTEARTIAGISYRKLDYWTRTGLLIPAGVTYPDGRPVKTRWTELAELDAERAVATPGSGYARRWDRREVLVMAVLAECSRRFGIGPSKWPAIARAVRAGDRLVKLGDEAAYVGIDVDRIEAGLHWPLPRAG
jgi:hypothetical protein